MSRACRLSIYLGNADTHEHRALSGEIVHRAHRAGLAGATTVQGIEGFGRSHTIHEVPHWGLRDRSPICVCIIDTPDKIRGFLPLLDDLATQLVIVRDDVELLDG
ncbi:MAG TPA: DUF190 domain-containing protein [Jatrophihabitantaceae bacterium]|jgi:hypothetical protein